MKESIIFSERNLTEKIHFVYRVTIDGYYYGGKHSGSLDDLHTGRYKTSSKLVKEKLENGHRFTKIKILKVFSTKEEALEYEEKYLTRVDAKRNPKFLNQTNGNKDFYLKQHSEKSKEKISEKAKERFNPETEEGRKQREINSKSKKEYYKTERGRKQREIRSETQRNNWDPNTERGRKLRENISENKRKFWDKNTEEGRKRSKNHSEFMKENRKIITQKRVETNLQKRKDASILGELMFDEEFIREHFLITDDKNNPRFLSSVYSKLSRYCESQIRKEKRIGKLNFLHGINSIKLSEEQELAKIEEIKAIIKSRNEELSLKVS